MALQVLFFILQCSFKFIISYCTSIFALYSIYISYQFCLLVRIGIAYTRDFNSCNVSSIITFLTEKFKNIYENIKLYLLS